MIEYAVSRESVLPMTDHEHLQVLAGEPVLLSGSPYTSRQVNLFQCAFAAVRGRNAEYGSEHRHYIVVMTDLPRRSDADLIDLARPVIEAALNGSVVA